MRPPHSWLLMVVASLLMTSSTVMGTPPAPITVVNGCPTTDTQGCVNADENSVPPNKKITCGDGFILEQDVLDNSLLKLTPVLKAACYPKCHSKFLTNKCPIADCKEAIDAVPDELSCTTGYSLNANGKKTDRKGITCNNVKGWTNTAGDKIVDFTAGDHHIRTFCEKDPAPPPTICGPASFKDECHNCADTPVFDPASPTTLKCPASSKLMYQSKPFDRVKCDKATKEWKGFKTAASAPETLVALIAPLPILHVKCLSYCKDRWENTCIPPAPKCPTDTPVLSGGKTLKCANSVLQIDGLLYNDATCSSAGWKSGVKTLVDYSVYPFANLRVQCKPYDTMFEDYCPAGTPNCAANPTYDDNTKTLTCKTANHRMIVNDPSGREIVVLTNVKSTATGWEILGPPPVALVVYSTKVEKLKARCFSRCHTRFVDTTCTPPCNKPIYMNEGQPLFCRSADEELFLEEKKVPDVVCDATGWREAGKPTSDLLLDFTTFTAEKVKAACKRITGSTPAPPVINGTDRPTNQEPKIKGESEAKTYILISLVVVLALTVGGLGMFLWRIQKKKKDDDDEGHSKTKTKSNSKNNSSKNKKGKKGNKKSKNASKKGKKGKKDSSKKQKKEKEADIDSNVEVPEHQMSEANSTVPLTAALGVGSPPNPNVMDV